jgi:hypothetical protein
VKDYLKKNGDLHLPKRAATPLPAGYRPKMDVTPELGVERASYYMSQIGILRWCVELGRVNIITEVSILASHLALPREGHLDAVFHMYAYLEKKHNSQMVFDPTYPSIDRSKFIKCNWKEFYGNVQEVIPSNASEPRGKDVDLRLFVDSDHAGDDQRIRQPTIETSIFGAEFMAMKNGMETLRGLHYKLHMMGVPISVHHISMETTCPSFTILSAQNRPSRRDQILSVTMRFEKPLLWAHA